MNFIVLFVNAKLTQILNSSQNMKTSYVTNLGFHCADKQRENCQYKNKYIVSEIHTRDEILRLFILLQTDN